MTPAPFSSSSGLALRVVAHWGEPKLLRAKVIVVDRRMALVGSSNLSRSGLLNNHELAVLVEGLAAADVARALDLLLRDAVPG